jgi:hypothetical protein
MSQRSMTRWVPLMIKKAEYIINPIVMEIETNPKGCADAARRKARYEQNWDWLEAHSSEVYAHRGKFVCMAGQELFVGDTVIDVLRSAEAAHPEDDGRFTRYIPLVMGPRIYAAGTRYYEPARTCHRPAE